MFPRRWPLRHAVCAAGRHLGYHGGRPCSWRERMRAGRGPQACRKAAEGLGEHRVLRAHERARARRLRHHGALESRAAGGLCLQEARRREACRACGQASGRRCGPLDRASLDARGRVRSRDAHSAHHRRRAALGNGALRRCRAGDRGRRVHRLGAHFFGARPAHGREARCRRRLHHRHDHAFGLQQHRGRPRRQAHRPGVRRANRLRAHRGYVDGCGEAHAGRCGGCHG